MNMRAKRRYPRARVDRPVLISLIEPDPYREKIDQFTRTRVIGPGGCMFQSKVSLGFGSLAEVVIALGERTVKADARVAWESDRGPDRHDVGLEFLRISREDRASISALVAQTASQKAHQRQASAV
jgi:PilZ domain